MSDFTWAPPGDGVWWLTREHFPTPVSALFATLFPPVTAGWTRGAARYGLPLGPSRWAAVNSWLYFSPGPEQASSGALADAARETLATKRWRGEVRRWVDVERPPVVAENRTLQAVDPTALSDAELREHFEQAVTHFAAVAPLHFEHTGFDVAAGRLFLAAREWDVDPAAVAQLLAGASPASSAAAGHLDQIAAALTGVATPSSLADVRSAGPAAVAALDAYLDEYGWRLLSNDVATPTLAERPEVVVTTIRARVEGTAAAPRTGEPGVDAIRSRILLAERARFDELLADARLTYGLRDDDGGVCYSWPLGLVRRAVLEAGQRLVSRGVLLQADHLFEGDPAEISALIAGDRRPAAALADRFERRAAAAHAEPPLQLGEMTEGPGTSDAAVPPEVQELVDARAAYWGVDPRGPKERLRGTGIGSGSARGRACVIDAPDAVEQIEPGDVLVATMTTSAHNALFPIAAAVATAEGGLFSHAAILARELGIPAVVGVEELLDEIHTGDVVEVDPVAGTVTLVAAFRREPVAEPVLLHKQVR
jgi:pyruvate,water dikinase